MDSKTERQIFVETLQISKTISEKVNSVIDFEILLNTILELSLQFTEAERGFLLLTESGSQGLSIKATLNIDNDISELEYLSKLFDEKIKPLFKEQNTVSINIPNIGPVISSKLKLRNNLLGYICLLEKKPFGFYQQEKDLLEIIANHGAIAINNVQLYQKIEYETNIRNNLQRYLPRNTVLKLLDGKINLSMQGELQVCSVLFSDICGFTTLSEKMKPGQVVAFLNEYLTIMSKVIFSYNGSIDKYIGDGIMAVFGAPVSTPNHAMEATLAALEMKNQIPALQEKFKKDFGIQNFNIRIGINTGPVVYGNVGSPQRLDFTVIGDTVNTASRMESNAPKGGILVSISTYENIKAMVNTVSLGTISVKGKRDPVKVFEVLEKNNAYQSLNPKVSVSEKTKNILIGGRVPVKSFVVINKEGNITNGMLRNIGLKNASIGVMGTYSLLQVITLSFKLSDKFSFKNIKGVIKNIEKSNQDFLNKNHVLLDIEFIDLANTELRELTAFVQKNKQILQ